MIAFEVYVEELFLAEGFVVVVVGIRFFFSVSAFVYYYVFFLKKSRVGRGFRVCYRVVILDISCVYVDDKFFFFKDLGLKLFIEIMLFLLGCKSVFINFSVYLFVFVGLFF